MSEAWGHNKRWKEITPEQFHVIKEPLEKKTEGKDFFLILMMWKFFSLRRRHKKRVEKIWDAHRQIRLGSCATNFLTQKQSINWIYAERAQWKDVPLVIFQSASHLPRHLHRASNLWASYSNKLRINRWLHWITEAAFFSFPKGRSRGRNNIDY